MTGESWPAVRSDTLTNQVYEILREKVLSGEMTPGEFIREKDVSERLGVSRTPVREALGRLASEGFLERHPHRGFQLPEETMTDLLELYPIITALEELAAKQAFNELDEAAIAELKRVNAAYERACRKKDIYAAIDHNHEFHDLLSKRSGNGRLCRMLTELRSKVRSLEVWAFSDSGHWEQSVEEHEAVLEAIESKDYPRALEILEHNRLTTYRQFLERANSEQASSEAASSEPATE